MDFFRGRYSWRKLGALLDRLPSWSAFSEVRFDDPEYAEMVAAESERRGTSDSAWHPPLTEFTPQVAMLADVIDRLGDVITATLMAAGADSPPKFQPTPRPRTAVDRLRVQREKQRHESLVAEVNAAMSRWSETH